jgi:hypothetical protein
MGGAGTGLSMTVDRRTCDPSNSLLRLQPLRIL